MNMTDLIATTNRALRTTSNDRELQKLVTIARKHAVKCISRGKPSFVMDVLLALEGEPGQPPTLQARAELAQVLGVGGVPVYLKPLSLVLLDEGLIKPEAPAKKKAYAV